MKEQNQLKLNWSAIEWKWVPRPVPAPRPAQKQAAPINKAQAAENTREKNSCIADHAKHIKIQMLWYTN